MYLEYFIAHLYGRKRKLFDAVPFRPERCRGWQFLPGRLRQRSL